MTRHVPTITTCKSGRCITFLRKRGAGYKTENIWLGVFMPQPSLAEARYGECSDYHLVRFLRDLNPAITTKRSLRDLTPKCLRHIGVPRVVGRTDNRE
ncbi:MAG: hypothetical protein ACI30S_00740 [Muribaculaceae bacterium]